MWRGKGFTVHLVNNEQQQKTCQLEKSMRRKQYNTFHLYGRFKKRKKSAIYSSYSAGSVNWACRRVRKTWPLKGRISTIVEDELLKNLIHLCAIK